MRLSVNGREREFPPSARVSDVLVAAGVDPGQRGVAVAVDGQVVSRAAWPTHRLAAGARIEIVRATAGG